MNSVIKGLVNIVFDVAIQLNSARGFNIGFCNELRLNG